jgi:lysine-N-methylase
MKLLQPSYFEAFHCIGASCEDTCCAGWIVQIDKTTYGKYQSCSDPVIGPALRMLVTIHAGSTKDDDYAAVTLNGAVCPFLSEGLCSIQARLGEDYLSNMCATYPRIVTRVDDVLQRSLDLSCPEVARLALLDPSPIQFVEREYRGDSDAPEVDFPGLREARRRAISLLQDRSYPIATRLLMLGDLTPEGSPDPGAQVEILSDLLVARLNTDPCPRRFLECYQEFIGGLQWTVESTMHEIGVRYAEAYSRYYVPFMSRHEHILENYLVNYVHRTLFPLGTPESNQRLRDAGVSSPAAAQYALLVAHFAIVKGLLIGMAAFHQSALDTGHVVKLIQSCSKTFEHSITYPGRVVEILASSSLGVLVQT